MVSLCLCTLDKTYDLHFQVATLASYARRSVIALTTSAEQDRRAAMPVAGME